MTARPALRSAFLIVALAAWTADGAGAAQDLPALDVREIVARAGERVADLFGRARSLICTEVASIQRLDSGFGPLGFGRTVESDLRFWWDPADGEGPDTTASVRREVRLVNDRPPRENDPNNCTTPEQQQTETRPLSMLLPEERREYTFAPAGTERIDGRLAYRVDFEQQQPVSVDVSTVDGREDCISYELDGGLRGRLWIDAETMEVLRLDQHLVGMIDIPLPREVTRSAGSASRWTLERWSTSIRYGRVTFKDPDESLILPLKTTTLRFMRGGGAPRVRTETKYTNYQRFVTGARIVGGGGEP